MNKDSKIYIAGHSGLAGSAIVRRLQREGYQNLITRKHSTLDLTHQQAVHNFFVEERPEFVFLAAGRVGGIMANNTYRGEFIYQNLMIEVNVIDGAFRSGVQKLLFLGSSCIYPKYAPQPMKEEHLLTGMLEPTNEPYAIAKIAGLKICEAYNRQYGTNFLSVMPTNLYGPGDNYDLEKSHVLPALIRRMHEAKKRKENEVVIWGSGSPRRELLHSDDLADACVYLMQHWEAEHSHGLINVGVGEDYTIHEISEIVREVVGFSGRFHFDTSKPDGTPQKLLDISRLEKLGWSPKIQLRDGVRRVYQDFLDSEIS